MYGPKYIGAVSWMPYEISWNMWRCDEPVPPITFMIVVAFGAPLAVEPPPPVMSNIIAAIVRGDLDGAVISAPPCVVVSTGLG